MSKIARVKRARRKRNYTIGTTVPPKPTGGTRVGNGKTLWLEGVDPHSLLGRRFKEVFAKLCSDLGTKPTEAQMQIARRAAALTVWSEMNEAKLAQGKGFNVTAFITASNTLRRLLETLGLGLRRETEAMNSLKRRASSLIADDEEMDEEDTDDEEDEDIDKDITAHVLGLNQAERAAFDRLSPAEQRKFQELTERALVRG